MNDEAENDEAVNDDILEEVYAARRRIAEECDYDFDKLLARYKRMQAEDPEGLVDHVPKSDPKPPST
jgi:hypothetical protein